MAWTALTNFANGDTPTAAQLNAYVANLEYIHDLPTDSYTAPQGADMSTTAITWADISASFNLSLTTVGGDVLVLFHATGDNAEFDIEVDGTRRGTSGVSGSGIATFRTAGGVRHSHALTFVIHGLSAAAHTFKAQWRVPVAGTARIFTSNAPRFFVREL